MYVLNVSTFFLFKSKCSSFSMREIRYAHCSPWLVVWPQEWPESCVLWSPGVCALPGTLQASPPRPPEDLQLQEPKKISTNSIQKPTLTQNCQLLTLTGVRFDVHERFTDKGNGIDIVVEFADYSVIAAGDGDGGFVTLHFTDTVKLRDFIPFFHIPDDESIIMWIMAPSAGRYLCVNKFIK